MKAATIENVIRTLKETLLKYASLTKTYKWIDILPEIVATYKK